jgi:hypothetical protein
VGDAEWICQLVERGSVRPFRVPLKEIRELRGLTGYRNRVEGRRREAKRLEKVLQNTGLKLSSVPAKSWAVGPRHA